MYLLQSRVESPECYIILQQYTVEQLIFECRKFSQISRNLLDLRKFPAPEFSPPDSKAKNLS